MTEEEKFAITRLAIKAVDYERRFGRKFYEYNNENVKFDSATDARTALNYIIKNDREK